MPFWTKFSLSYSNYAISLSVMLGHFISQCTAKLVLQCDWHRSKYLIHYVAQLC